MGTVGVLGAVEGDDLVAPDVVAGREVLGDLDDPRVVVGNQLRGSPCSGEGLVRDQTDGGDLEEFEVGLVNGRAVTVVALGKHVDDGAVVGVGPCAPVDLDVVTCLHGGVTSSVRGVLVADDVARSVGIRGDVAVVGIRGSPSNADWGVGLVAIFG